MTIRLDSEEDLNWTRGINDEAESDEGDDIKPDEVLEEKLWSMLPMRVKRQVRKS